MTPTTILDGEFATVSCHPEEGFVHLRIKRFDPIMGADLRTALEAVIEALARHPYGSLLSDDRLAGKVRSDVEAWARTVWHPQMVRSGWKRWGIVVPESVVGQLAMQRFAQDFRADGNVEVGMFTTPDAAKEWLTSS